MNVIFKPQKVFSSKAREIIIYSFNNYLLSIHSVAGPGLGAKGIVGNETESCIMEHR